MVDLTQLENRITQLKQDCIALDQRFPAEIAKGFSFNRSLFPKKGDSLICYLQQIEHSFATLQEAINRKCPNDLIGGKCQKLTDQFSALFQLVNQLKQGKPELFIYQPSREAQSLYNKLKQQYEYEGRLDAMVEAAREDLKQAHPAQHHEVKAKLDALKERLQRCQNATRVVEERIRKHEESNSYIGNF